MTISEEDFELEKDALIKHAAELFTEMVGLANVGWDKAYYRFCLPDEGYHNSSWSYVKDKELGSGPIN